MADHGRNQETLTVNDSHRNHLAHTLDHPIHNTTMKRSGSWSQLPHSRKMPCFPYLNTDHPSSDATLVDEILSSPSGSPIRSPSFHPALKSQQAASVTFSVPLLPKVHKFYPPKLPVTRSTRPTLPAILPSRPVATEVQRPVTPPVCDHARFGKHVARRGSDMEHSQSSQCTEDPSNFLYPSPWSWTGASRKPLGASSPESQHRGKVRPCENGAAHEEGVPTVCEECACIGHHHLEKHWPKLLESPLLPLCPLCSQTAKQQHPTLYLYLGCRCPVSNPTTEGKRREEKWLCFDCRLRELRTVNVKLEIEEEYRRGVLGVRVNEGKIEAMLVGRMCVCLRELGGRENLARKDAARRCAGCGEFCCGGAG